MARNSIDYSFADAATKARLKAELDAAFRAFERRTRTATRTDAVIDSHCHLADETFAADLEQVVRRAQDAGLERALVILEAGNAKEAAQAGARRAALAGRPVRDRRPSASGAPVRRRPERAAAPSSASSSRRRRRRGRSARSASTTTTTTRRATCSTRSSARRSGSPASCDCPVVIHTREADEDTLAILREEGGGRAARRAALLHRHAGAGATPASTSASTSRWPGS